MKPVKSRSLEARDALLRGGAGKHLDRRTKRRRDRSTARRKAIQDAT